MNHRFVKNVIVDASLRQLIASKNLETPEISLENKYYLPHISYTENIYQNGENINHLYENIPGYGLGRCENVPSEFDVIVEYKRNCFLAIEFQEYYDPDRKYIIRYENNRIQVDTILATPFLD